jgi:hypothetical protein
LKFLPSSNDKFGFTASPPGGCIPERFAAGAGRFSRRFPVKFATLKKKVLAGAFAQIEKMSADELLEYVSRPLFPWEERNPTGPVQTARRYAFNRLDLLTR